jgi:dihydroneopterin aldolase
MSDAPTVVKLGGSLAGSPLLRPWLQAIEAAAGSVVIVPGGGPFADAVRATQPVMGFDDRAAHVMALLAMAQYAVALASLGSKLIVAADGTAIEQALSHEQVPVWSPWPMLCEVPDVAESWDVTSDSLALWLATRLQARRVVIVKHRVPSGASAQQLVADAIVDAAFPRFLAGFPGVVMLAAVADSPAAILAADHGFATIAVA